MKKTLLFCGLLSIAIPFFAVVPSQANPLETARRCQEARYRSMQRQRAASDMRTQAILEEKDRQRRAYLEYQRQMQELQRQQMMQQQMQQQYYFP